MCAAFLDVRDTTQISGVHLRKAQVNDTGPVGHMLTQQLAGLEHNLGLTDAGWATQERGALAGVLVQITLDEDGGNVCDTHDDSLNK